MVTLSGEGDWCAILWQWDSFKMLAKVDLNVVDPLDTSAFQISLYYTTQMVCTVTGQNTYKFFKLEDNMRAFKETHS